MICFPCRPLRDAPPNSSQAGGVGGLVAGGEQVLRTTREIAGMGLMGLGGLIAIVGGMLFVFIVLQAVWRGRSARQLA